MFGYAAFSEVPYASLPEAGVVYSVNIAEGSAANDVVFAVGSFVAIASEAAQGNDVVASTVVFLNTISEAGNLADSTISSLAYPVMFADSAAINDEATSDLIYGRIVSEAATGSEVVSSIAVQGVSVSEAAEGADVTTGDRLLPNFIQEAGEGADEVDTFLSFQVKIEEFFECSASVFSNADFVVTVSDGVSVQDLITGGILYQITIFENVNIVASPSLRLQWEIIDNSDGTNWQTIPTLN